MKHIYARGNFKNDMFFDKLDLVSAWNRFFLTADRTGTPLCAAIILSNHFHSAANPRQEPINGRIMRGVTGFIHSLRMSFSIYHNHKNGVSGSLGERKYGCSEICSEEIDGGDDLRDLICYIIRNPYHHGITKNFLEYKYSTGAFLFGLTDLSECYTSETVPDGLRYQVLPSPHILPKGWLMMKDGRIVPPPHIFPYKELEAMFGSVENYLAELQKVTRRELEGGEERDKRSSARRNRITDEMIVEFLRESECIPISQMDTTQKLKAIVFVLDNMGHISIRQLARVFHIPSSTLAYKLSNVGHF